MEKKKKETKAKFLIFSFNLSVALQTTLHRWILSQFPPSKFQNWAAPFKYSTQPNPSHSQVISLIVHCQNREILGLYLTLTKERPSMYCFLDK